MTFIVTVSGKRFDFVDPRPEQICIEDIAHALAVIPRFVGHSRWPEYGTAYSVGQHSVHTMELVMDAGGSVYEQLWALLHDASEAYMGDCSTPLKRLLPDFRVIEERVEHAIHNTFGLEHERPMIVDWADKQALRLEARDLHHQALAAALPVEGELRQAHPLSAWVPRYTQVMFLRTYINLKRNLRQ